MAPGSGTRVSPASSRSAGISPSCCAPQRPQARMCRAIRLRHSGLGTPSQSAMVNSRPGHGGSARSARTTTRHVVSCSFSRPMRTATWVARQAERGDELVAVQFPGGLQPPQREQFAVPGVEPAGGLRGLLTLAGQAEPEDGQLHEVGLRIGHLVAQVGGRHGLPGPVVIAHLPDGHRDQPGPERGGVAQVAQAAHGAEHGFLHHVVHVGVPAEAAADDVVDQGQVAGQQAVQRLRVPGLGGDHRLHPGPAAARHVHGTSPSSVWAAGLRPRGETPQHRAG